MSKNIPFVFQAAFLLAAPAHPIHIVIYAPGMSGLAVSMQLEIYWV
ncbi:RNA polymerase subunit sigma-70 [Citrobacter murliniae]|uniref:RNA polymerase subunit sigma-70 n=1 Tax=Citrobacter murliniae TaxID=67829 RepID=A0ABY2PWT9_9ENTR|nr:RNA polymerase subunit sigma-70 [Citrobacter murliniae]